jgi:hypothetical protein
MSDTPSQPAGPEAPAVPEAPPLPWADVQPEHCRMLRLAPLPTDRSTGARPLRFVQFAFAERHSKDLSLLRMAITLPGQRVRSEQNQLDVWVDHTTHHVRFSPERGLQTEPVNRGIGRFLLAQAALWAQKKWSHYRVEGIDLPSRDALNEDSRLRRDHFLRVHGFDVVYADALFLKARIEAMQVGELLDSWNGEKLQFLDVLEPRKCCNRPSKPCRNRKSNCARKKKRSASSSVKTPGCVSPSRAWWRSPCFRPGC